MKVTVLIMTYKATVPGPWLPVTWWPINFFLSHSAWRTLASLFLLTCKRQPLVSEPLQRLFQLLRIFFPQVSSCFLLPHLSLYSNAISTKLTLTIHFIISPLSSYSPYPLCSSVFCNLNSTYYLLTCVINVSNVSFSY